MIKPGYKTSEFWLTAVSFVFSGLYLVGLLDSNSQKEDLIMETSRGVESLILIIGQLTILCRYIRGRTEIKKLWWTTASESERKEATRAHTKTKTKTKRKTKTKGKTNDDIKPVSE